MGFTPPKLDKCCFFVELDLGCQIIGFFEMFVGIIISILAIIGIIFGITNPVVLIAGILLLIIGVCEAAIGFLLVRGVREKNPRHVKLWIIVTLVLIVLNIIQFILNVIDASHGGSSLGGSIISILLQIYFLLVVNSFYEEITVTT